MIFVNLFVYGSLLDPKTRENVFGRPIPYMEPDTISGYEIDGLIIEEVSYPALVRNTSSMVHGGIVIIHEGELRLLDEYETESYCRIFVRLMSGKEAWVYAKREDHVKNTESMEEKVLYNVLRQISRRESTTAAPDEDYVKALITIGMVKDGWDMELTELGASTLNRLGDKLYPWGT